ncbi:MAG: hypothetical protein IIZ39_10875, partial [Blautia sp.]|nr:hypothetical protein [Blautia sp.]
MKKWNWKTLLALACTSAMSFGCLAYAEEATEEATVVEEMAEAEATEEVVAEEAAVEEEAVAEEEVV